MKAATRRLMAHCGGLNWLPKGHHIRLARAHKLRSIRMYDGRAAAVRFLTGDVLGWVLGK